MVVAFLGHSDFRESIFYENRILNILEEITDADGISLYFGGYGAFDLFALKCGKKYKEKYCRVKLSFITPYIYEGYSKLDYAKTAYDEIIYPPIEQVPLKFAIVKRNEWMMRNADLIIAYITRGWGGAATTLEYAKKQGKKVINIAK